MFLAKTKSRGKLASVIVTTADGRIFDLGAPSSRLFELRRRHYLWKRRHEIPKSSYASQEGKG